MRASWEGDYGARRSLILEGLRWLLAGSDCDSCLLGAYEEIVGEVEEYEKSVPQYAVSFFAGPFGVAPPGGGFCWIME